MPKPVGTRKQWAGIAVDYAREIEKLEVELAKLREENDYLKHMLMQDTVPNEYLTTHDEQRREIARLRQALRGDYRELLASKDAEISRLREELRDYKQAAEAEAQLADEFKAQRDTHLAALREWALHPYSEVEGEKK